MGYHSSLMCDECNEHVNTCRCGPDQEPNIPREAKANVIDSVLSEIHYSPTGAEDVAEWWHYDLDAKAERDARDFDFDATLQERKPCYAE